VADHLVYRRVVDRIKLARTSAQGIISARLDRDLVAHTSATHDQRFLPPQHLALVSHNPPVRVARTPPAPMQR
jgi:hypothetical protein